MYFGPSQKCKSGFLCSSILCDVFFFLPGIHWLHLWVIIFSQVRGLWPLSCTRGLSQSGSRAPEDLILWHVLSCKCATSFVFQAYKLNIIWKLYVLLEFVNLPTCQHLFPLWESNIWSLRRWRAFQRWYLGTWHQVPWLSAHPMQNSTLCCRAWEASETVITNSNGPEMSFRLGKQMFSI